MTKPGEDGASQEGPPDREADRKAELDTPPLPCKPLAIPEPTQSGTAMRQLSHETEALLRRLDRLFYWEFQHRNSSPEDEGIDHE